MYRIETGDIFIVFNKESFFHKVIGAITGKSNGMKAGHVFMYLFDDLIIEASVRYGVNIRNMPSFKPNKHIVYRARLVGGLHSDYQHYLVRLALLKVRYKYSFLQILLLLFKYVFGIKHIPDASKKAVICSELIADLYNEIGIKLFDKPSYEVVPKDYLKNINLVVMAYDYRAE